MLDHNFLMKINLPNSLNSITWLSQSLQIHKVVSRAPLLHSFLWIQPLKWNQHFWSLLMPQSLGRESKVVLVYWSRCAISIRLSHLPSAVLLHKPSSPLLDRICSSQRLIAYYPVPCDLWGYWKLISSSACPWCQPLKSLTMEDGGRELQTNI